MNVYGHHEVLNEKLVFGNACVDTEISILNAVNYASEHCCIDFKIVFKVPISSLMKFIKILN